MDTNTRLTRVETQLEGLIGTVGTIAADLRLVRDKVLTENARSSGAARTMGAIAAVVTLLATVGLTVAAFAALHR